MTNKTPNDRDIAAAVLRLFAPGIRGAILDRRTFRDRFGIGVDATVTFARPSVRFARSSLFAAVRGVLSGAENAQIHSKDAATWNVSRRGRRPLVVLTREHSEIA